MAHFAEVIDGIVQRVLVVEQDYINTGKLGNPTNWIQTSYNTSGGVHLLGGTPLRKNYAGVGFTYDTEIDAFIPPKLYNSWLLNEETCCWEPPIPYPTDGNMYTWDEDQLNWILVENKN